ncbi:MAG: hypothetical protein L0210_11405 [Rhodospirillales bacterium]|nr:hypothetical protein [Rhodospirillales bacterium]
MRVGVIDLLVDAPLRGWREHLYVAYFRKQFMSIMPQVVSVWCRQLRHEVHYTTYYGVGDPAHLLPDDLNVVFISTYTQASALAYALAKLFRKRRILTVIGGPHAKSFPHDCLRFFDLVVQECDKALIDDILQRRFDVPAIISSGRVLADFPSVEERMPEIQASAFVRGRAIRTSLVPMLASIGCPYRCDFCVDWNTDYVALPENRLEADLRYLSDNHPRLLIGFHDPNFAVRFNRTMDVMERIEPERRNGYIMESSLSILKESHLHRLRATNCLYVAPGIESWSDYSNKAGASGKEGRQKLEHVIAHFQLLGRFVPAMQANFLFGADVDRGLEPVELTKEFIRRLPLVWPTINIPTPFGATPLYARYVAEGRILRPLPFAFYYNPYLAITLKHYDPVAYYDHLIDMHDVMASRRMLTKRLLARSRPAVRFIHGLRTFAARRELAAFRHVRTQLVTDPAFKAFHEGRSKKLPAYYHWMVHARLGHYADLLSPADLTPRWDQAECPMATTKVAASVAV